MTASPERHARSDPSPLAQAELLRERMRRGALEARRVSLAARLGHEAAGLLFPDTTPPELSEAFAALDAPELRSYACDCAEGVLGIFERFRPGDARPRLAIEAARRGDGDLEVSSDAARAAGDELRSILMITAPPDQPGINRWRARALARHAAYAAAHAADPEPRNAAARAAEHAAAAAALSKDSERRAKAYLRRRAAELLLGL